MSLQERSKGEQRRGRIMVWLKRHGKITVQEVIEHFQCSEATARRDLDLMELSGSLIRTIGGAQLEGFAGAGSREVSFDEKKRVLWLEKEAIAAKAASMVEEGDVIGLTGGTTTFLIAKAVKLKRNITVVTNAINIAMELTDSEGVQVVVTGGVLRNKSFELAGPLAEKTVAGLHIGKMFLGIDGISIEQGLTTYSEPEAEIAKLLIKRSSQTIAVFDHSKAGRTSLFSMIPLSAMHACITDKKPDEQLDLYLREHRIHLHIAE